MKSDNKKPKLYHVALWVMLFGIFTDTLGQFIPVYFIYLSWIAPFYTLIFLMIWVPVPLLCYRQMYNPVKKNTAWAITTSAISAVLVFIIAGFFTIGKMVAVWTDAATLYTKKDNPGVQIVSRYINLGAQGGGTELSDYQVVLKRPITPLFKMETPIDTTTLNKREWVRKSVDVMVRK